MEGQEHNAFRQFLLGGVLTDEQKRRIAYHRVLHEQAWRTRYHNPQWTQMAIYLNNGSWDPKSDWDNVRWFSEDERYPDDVEKQRRRTALLQRGIVVRCRVYLSQWEPLNPQLQIRLTRVNRAGNTRWLSNKTEAGKRNPYHVTIGYLTEIQARVPNWQMHLRRLIRKFHEHNYHLWVSGFSSGGNVYLDEQNDPIATDPDFMALRAPYRTSNPGNINYPHVTQ